MAEIKSLQFHTELVDFFRRRDGIVAGVAGQTEILFGQAGGPDRARFAGVVRVCDVRAKDLRLMSDIVTQKMICFLGDACSP